MTKGQELKHPKQKRHNNIWGIIKTSKFTRQTSTKTSKAIRKAISFSRNMVNMDVPIPHQKEMNIHKETSNTWKWKPSFLIDATTSKQLYSQWAFLMSFRQSNWRLVLMAWSSARKGSPRCKPAYKPNCQVPRESWTTPPIPMRFWVWLYASSTVRET